MKLFRGDNKFNQFTRPDLYRYDGLRSKAFGSGSDPAYLDKNGLIESLRQHIRPLKDSYHDNSFYEKTEFISFSEDIERSIFWLTDKNGLKLKELEEPYSETRYLFTIDIPDNELIQRSYGIYSYRFNCNFKLKTSNTPSLLLQATEHLMYGTNDCELCHGKWKTHEIVLINAVEYLQLGGSEKFSGALEYAKNDKEWLVLPFDAMEEGGFKYARIPRANFWTVKHFTTIEDITRLK